MNSAIETVYSRLEKLGLKGRFVSLEKLQDAEGEIEGHHAQGLFDEKFSKEALSFL